MPASWAGEAWPSAMPRMAASLFIACAGIDLGRAAIADDDDAAAHGDDAEVLLQIGIGEHLEDDVHAAVVREPHQLVEVARRRVVEDVVGALLQDEPPAAVGARGADHGEAARPRELHRADAHAAARAVHEHGLARVRRGRD